MYRPPFIRTPDQLRILQEDIKKMMEGGEADEDDEDEGADDASDVPGGDGGEDGFDDLELGEGTEGVGDDAADGGGGDAGEEEDKPLLADEAGGDDDSDDDEEKADGGDDDEAADMLKQFKEQLGLGELDESAQWCVSAERPRAHARQERLGSPRARVFFCSMRAQAPTHVSRLRPGQGEKARADRDQRRDRSWRRGHGAASGLRAHRAKHGPVLAAAFGPLEFLVQPAGDLQGAHRP